MNKRTLVKVLALCTLALSGAAMAQGALRIGFFPGPYADQFKRGVQPTLAHAPAPCTALARLSGGSHEPSAFATTSDLPCANARRCARVRA